MGLKHPEITKNPYSAIFDFTEDFVGVIRQVRQA
jgi:hypothetical protein